MFWGDQNEIKITDKGGGKNNNKLPFKEEKLHKILMTFLKIMMM